MTIGMLWIEAIRDRSSANGVRPVVSMQRSTSAMSSPSLLRSHDDSATTSTVVQSNGARRSRISAALPIPTAVPA